jgi:hypothetical protein
MKDNFFKKLSHNAKGYLLVNSGGQLTKGYKPDIVLNKGNEYIIMECDTGTSRKGYLGAMLKAARFLTNENEGMLILVIKEKTNTTVKQIAAHLQEYLTWLQPLTNLRIVYLIKITQYCTDKIPIKILSEAFKKEAIIISANS